MSDVICIRAWRSDRHRVQFGPPLPPCNIRPLSPTQLGGSYPILSSWHIYKLETMDGPISPTSTARRHGRKWISNFMWVQYLQRDSAARFQICLKSQPCSKLTFNTNTIHLSGYFSFFLSLWNCIFLRKVRKENWVNIYVRTICFTISFVKRSRPPWSDKIWQTKLRSDVCISLV